MTPAPKTPAPAPRENARSGPHYRVEVLDAHAHLYAITLTVRHPAPQQQLSLPVWIPGSYLVREFSKHLQGLRAQQGARTVPVQQLDKSHWCVHSRAGQALTVRYEVYAYDASVRTAWLDAARAFFNGTSLCLAVQGQEHWRHTLELVAPPDAPHWSVATGAEAAKVDDRGFGSYQAPDYDTLVDCPVEMGAFWSGRFQACGVEHQFVVAGAPPGFDGARLLADTQAICETELRFWHGPEAGSRQAPIPFNRYVFLLNAVGDGYGGLEHSNSTALICKRQDLPRQSANPTAATTVTPEGYATLLGLISHEYFHTWNVKRLCPAELRGYDYQQENYTALLWLFEGFTSYYDDLLLLRSGRIDIAAYLKLLAKTINGVQQTPGRLVQSVAQASRDAWIKYYRPDENTPNATISYYTKGSLVALCLDLTLRAEGHTTLDAVMQALWNQRRSGPKAGKGLQPHHLQRVPIDEQDVRDTLQRLGARSFAAEIQRWVHGTDDLPVAALLERHGVRVDKEPLGLMPRVGLRLRDERSLVVQHVLRGSAAERAGFASGDEWLGVAPADAPEASWRVHSPDDVALYGAQAAQLRVLVARDRRLHTLLLHTDTPPCEQVRLELRDPSTARAWLHPATPAP